MTEAEWLACADPTPMLQQVQETASDRKLRLFAASCCRHTVVLRDHHPSTRKNLELISLLENYADGDPEGVIHPEDLEWIRENQDYEPFFLIWEENAAKLSLTRSREGATTAAVLLSAVGQTTTNQQGKDRVENRNVRFLVFDMFGNPFHPLPSLSPTVLAWNGGTVRRIAQGIYRERGMPEGTLDTARLAILHDALLDAGCDNGELLTHLRSDGPHVRGCWVVDLILGME